MSENSHGRTVIGPCDPPDLLPRRPRNRPALDEVAYRIGRHSDFLARMLHDLPHVEVAAPGSAGATRPLRTLTTRTTDDPTIALIDAWACSLDALTFYQERIANEGYLRTARERESVLELARMIGHELDPGVAASTALAFTVEDADDPFRVVDVPVGTQVMSIPKKSGEKPQLFETVETIAARAEWNAIPARTERAQNVALFWNPTNANDADNGKLYLLDLDNSFDLGSLDSSQYKLIDDASLSSYLPVTPGLDIKKALTELKEDAAHNPEIVPVIRALLTDHLHLRGLGLALRPGDRMLAVGVSPDDTQPVRTRPFRIAEIEEQPDFGLTRVAIVPIEHAAAPPAAVPPFELRFTPGQYRRGTVMAQPLPFNAEHAGTMVSRTAWTSAGLAAFMRTQAWPRVQLMRLFRAPPSAPPPSLGKAAPGLYVFRQSVGFFGNAAPLWAMLAKPGEARGTNPYVKPWDAKDDSTDTDVYPRPVWVNSQGSSLRAATGFDVFLEREVSEVLPENWALFETVEGETHAFRVARAAALSRADFALAGKATGLELREANGGPVDPFGAATHAEFEKFKFRTATARVASEALTLSGIPIQEPLTAQTAEVMLDGLYLDLEPGRSVSVRGKRSDAKGLEEAETCILADVTHVGGHTHLMLKGGLEFSYQRPSVRVNANVAAATHGEAITEPLGSGDTRQPNQAFKLAKPPLTFVSAPAATGSATTLSVRVDDIEWKEVAALYDAGPRDEVYQTRIDDDGTTRLVFGDGLHGKRLPSGNLNVRASYRSGMGHDGEVDEETLSLLKTRPLGVRGVTNASPAAGAADAETRDEAKTRAPQSVRTLGRVVSLTDYEDFARAFAGIGKAKAVTLWQGRQQIVHLTVTPVTEGVFAAADATLVNLNAAIERLRDPARPLVVAPHANRYFQLAAKVFYESRYRSEAVDAAVRAALMARFGFNARPLAEPVSAAAVIAAMQSVGGVDHVDLDVLAPFNETDTGASSVLESVLPAAPARLAVAGNPPQTLPPQILPAELLTLLEAGIKLTMVPANA